jgi:4-hydroxy-4-methyl-2-oxoglutarate aldolase
MINIIKNIKSPSLELLKAYSEQATATVHEAMGKRGAMYSSIKPLYSGMKACGGALTVKCQAGDNLMLLKALDMAQAGDVLVVDAGLVTEEGPWGELMTIQAVIKGLAGLVIDGSVRDSMAIKEHNFPVFCKGVSVIGTAKETVGFINHPITCGNTIVKPGDIILADEDGVVVIPLVEAEEILKNSQERVAKEQKLIERIRAGESIFDIAGFQEILDKKGCIESNFS